MVLKSDVSDCFHKAGRAAVCGHIEQEHVDHKGAGDDWMSAEGQRKGSERNRINADRFVAKLLPVIRELQASGMTEHRAIARELERRGIRTPRGGDWSGVQVHNILKRAEAGQ